MEKIKIKKTIDNKIYCHQVNVLLEEDDYAILDRYKDWAEVSLDEAVASMFSYTMRIVRNIMKYHKDFRNLESLIEYIAQESNIDLNSIKRNKKIYDQLFDKCKQHCEARCEYMPYERSYWYDILIELIQTNILLKQKNNCDIRN